MNAPAQPDPRRDRKHSVDPNDDAGQTSADAANHFCAPTEIRKVLDVAPLKRETASVQLFGTPAQKGIIVVQEEGGVNRRISLSITAFAVVLALAEQSRRDRSLQSWMPRGFLNKQQLMQQLAEWDARRLSPHYAVRHVFRARDQLGRQIGKVGALDGASWAREFLERSEALNAYRLSLPPEQIYIHPYEWPPP